MKCKNGAPPIVRLALAREKCPRHAVAEKVRTPTDIVNFVQKQYGCQAQEYFVALGISPASEPLGILEVAVGGLDQTAVDPRVLFSGLLLMGATSAVLCHNHPSADTSPSQADVTLTRQLAQSAKLLGIRLLDHIIVGPGAKWSSMLALGLMQEGAQ